jgi:hypothetical protein
MKSFIAIALAALATAIATTASAYSLSPPDTASSLRGRLTFYPDGHKPIKCTVTFHLRTRGFIKSAQVDSDGPGCPGLFFVGLPWNVAVGTPDTGQLGVFIFIVPGIGNCSQSIVPFQDNASGIWTLPVEGGSCVSGVLTSNPPVTIVP